MGENLPATAGDTGDMCLTPGLGRSSSQEDPQSRSSSSLEKAVATHSTIFAWKIPRTESAGL